VLQSQAEATWDNNLRCGEGARQDGYQPVQILMSAFGRFIAESAIGICETNGG